MQLNTLSPAPGSRKPKARVGRGIGSGSGKTCGRGHKGQKARSGGYHKVGFEGGQMPLQRRLPKFGFTSRKSLTHAEVRLNELDKMQSEVINLETLKAEGLVAKNVKTVKIVFSGEINRSVTIEGIKASKNAVDAIEKAGGKVQA